MYVLCPLPFSSFSLPYQSLKNHCYQLTPLWTNFTRTSNLLPFLPNPSRSFSSQPAAILTILPASSFRTPNPLEESLWIVAFMISYVFLFLWQLLSSFIYWLILLRHRTCPAGFSMSPLQGPRNKLRASLPLVSSPSTPLSPTKVIATTPSPSSSTPTTRPVHFTSAERGWAGTSHPSKCLVQGRNFW